MAMQQHIRNPIEWGWDQLKLGGRAVDVAAHSMDGAWEARDTGPIVVRRITAADLREVLLKGVQDFGAYRTDVIFLCLLYPVAGLVLSRLVIGYDMLPLLFPLVSGFALIAPLFAVGLYEMSRRREHGMERGWSDAFGVAASPALGSIVVMGLILLALFALWMFAAHILYLVTLGPEAPTSLSSFAHDVFETRAGWTMTILGVGIGFLFAVVSATISVVSFPLLLDRDVGVTAAITTSIRVVRENPGIMALWGAIIAASLVVGMVPLLVGLAVVLPVLGHATWHLYRKVLPR
ncbi:MAG TPA: DUF2189 domain-containing protein [Reyranella sp.]|nr:DUF2189 domain-containing protein [Reyranella sp.]